VVKSNQPGLQADLSWLFEGEGEGERPKELEPVARASSLDKGHGRLEKRAIEVSLEMKDFLAGEWAGLEQVFRLQREITHKGQTRREVVYGITSLPQSVADSRRLLELVRAHWLIENRLHWRRDVSLGEDGCQSWPGQVPQVLAALNNGVLSLLDRHKVKNVPEAQREFDADPAKALKLLLAG